MVFVTEHYRVDQKCVSVVMTDERKFLSAWLADPVSQRMVRQDELMIDVMENPGHAILSTQQFNDFCQSQDIDSSLPQRSLKLSWDLTQDSPTESALLIPFPCPTQDNMPGIPPHGHLHLVQAYG